MIQNILTFCVKNDLTFVDGSLPSGKLVANDINRNSIYLITPYFEATVFANFQSNLQADKPTSVIGVLVNGKIDISEVVDPSKSYYDLVKNWNIYEFKVPSYTLAFISRNRTNKIGIDFSIEQRLVPMIKPSYGDYLGEATRDIPFLTQSGYYIVKDPLFEFDDGITIFYGINDLFIYDVVLDKQTKINAYTNRGSTPTAFYSVDPSILNDNYEVIQPSLTTQISQQVNENSSNINLLFTNIGTNNATLISLENRVSQAEQDIDTAESNITNLQGRMNIAESDIENIEYGTTIVGKALKDSLGNTIKDHYMASVIPTYDDITNNLYLNPYNGNDSLMPTRVEGITLPKATTLKDGLMAKEDKAYVNGLPSSLLAKENKSEKGVANGYASLDGGAKIPTSQLPDSILGQLEYKGTFNPSSGYPVSPEKGWFYIAIANGLIGGVDYKVGDWAVYNGVSWDKVDNTDAVASVNGKLGVVILYGTEIQVGNGDTWTIEQRIVNIYAELNNRYTKAQTYSQNEIEQRITDLLGLANLQDVLIGTYTNGQTVLASDLSAYNFVIALGKDLNNTYTATFKPSEIVSGNVISLSSTVYLTRGATNFTITTPTSIKLWGIKLDGIGADEISYDNSTSGLVADKVQGAIDEVVVELNTLENKVDLTNTKQYIRINEIEELARKSASGETSDNVLGTDIIPLKKNTANAPMSVQIDGAILEAPNLVVNGDFENTSSWTPFGATLSVVNNNGLVINNGTATNGSIYQDILPLTDTLYFYGKVKVDNSNATFLRIRSGNQSMNVFQTTPIINQWYFLSAIGVSTNVRFEVRHEYLDNATANGKQMEVDYVGVYNVSTMKLKGVKNDNGILFTLLTDAQIKTQLDLWISKGILPNDNLLAVNMNKRVRSEVGGDTINEMYQLVSNYDLTIDSNSDSIPDGFTFSLATANSLVDGVFTFTATAQYGRLSQNINGNINDLVYEYAYVKSDSSQATITLSGSTNIVQHSGSNKYEFLSVINTLTSTSQNLLLTDYRTTGFTPISVDYMGVFNITQMKKDGWFVGMDNTQIKAFLDKVLQQGKANSDLYLQANTKGYSLPNGVKDTIEYKNGKYYFVKRVDDTDLNNLVELSPYVETEIEAWGNLQGYESGVVYVDDIKIDASIYNSGITTTSEIKALDEIVKITNGVETQLDASQAVIAVDKLSFTHPDLVDGDYVWFAYEEDGNYYKATTNITYYIDKLVRTSPDGSVWKLDWSVSNAGVITWTPTKI